MSYREYQLRKDQEYIDACNEAGIVPLIYRDKIVKHDSQKAENEISLIAGDRGEHVFFDDEKEPENRCSIIAKAQADAVLQVLFLLTKSRNPSLRMSADCLIALINRSEEKSQSAIARRYNVTRADVNKRISELRKGMLGELELYYFGGRKDRSEKAKERALKVHKQKKELCKQDKPSPFATINLS